MQWRSRSESSPSQPHLSTVLGTGDAAMRSLRGDADMRRRWIGWANRPDPLAGEIPELDQDNQGSNPKRIETAQSAEVEQLKKDFRHLQQP